MADRLGTAYWKLRNLTTAERINIPNIMAGRTLAAHVNRIAVAVDKIWEQLKTFDQKCEQKLDWLDARISSVESKFISNKH